jgi:hypothetical protein
LSERERRPSLGPYLLVGLGMAILLCILAVLGVTAGIVLYDAKVDSMRPLLIGLSVSAASYFLLCAMGAVALWLLYPLKNSLIAWMIRGAILLPIAYVTVGVSSVLLYVHYGINVMDYESPKAAWSSLWLSIPWFAFLGAVIGGPMGYFRLRYQRGKESRT